MATTEPDAALATTLAENLAECLGISFGEISFTVREGKVTFLHKRETVRLADGSGG